MPLYFYYFTAVALPLKAASAPVVQRATPGKASNQTSGLPLIPSDLQAVSALAAVSKPPFLPGINISDSNYTEWSPWSKCSTSCGLKAVMYRQRTCKLIGGKNCHGPNIEKKPCQFTKCPGIQTTITRT